MRSVILVVALLGLAASRQADSQNAERLITRLAIETAPDGDVPAIQVVTDRLPQVAIYDRFRLVALAARAAWRAGRPLDPENPPADLLRPRVVILGFPRTPLGADAPKPQAIRLTDRNGRAVPRLAVLKPDEVAVLLPGVDVPPLTLAVAFAAPSLRPSDRIEIVFNESPRMSGSPMGGVPIGGNPMTGISSGGMPGTFTATVSITPPKTVVETAPQAPAGVAIAAGRNVVKVEGVLDLTGRVRYARALDGPTELHEAAKAAVSGWKYEPAKIWAAPVPLVMQATVTFPSSFDKRPASSPPSSRR